MGSINNIFANLLFCIPYGLLMLVLFAHYRIKLPIFYHRNVLCNGKPVLGYKVKNRFFDWVKELLTITDAELLKVGGLDALVTSNAFRLILVFTCIMSVPCLLILAPYYYFNSAHSDGVDFESFTISDLLVDSFWPPVLVLVFLTLLVLYGIYTFYCNFVKLRQAFLLRPSSVDSAGSIARNAESFGSLKASRRRVDVATCTVMLHSIPSELCTSEEFLQDSLEKSGILGLKSIQFIGEYAELKEAMVARNEALAKLESKLKKFTEKLRKKQGSSSESEETTETPMTIKGKSALLRNLLLNPSLHEDIRKRKEIKGSDDKATESVDSLQYYHKKFMESEEKLQEAIKEFKSPDLKKLNATEYVNIENKEDFENFEERYTDRTALISWDRVRDVEFTMSHASSLGQGHSALLHFSDFRQAIRAQQTLMNSNANVMGSLIAPSPDTIHWRHINLSEKDRWFGALKSNFWYWALVISFAPVTAAIVSLVNMEDFAKWFPRIEAFRLAYPHLIEVLQGIVAPFIVNTISNLTEGWVYSIMAMRGPMSKADLALKAQSAHLAFLFTEVVVIGAIFPCTNKLASAIFASNSKTPIVDYLRDNIPKNSHFFFNLLFLDVFYELMLQLLNPKSLIFQSAFNNPVGRKTKSLRELYEFDTTPPELELQFDWTRHIVYPYFVFMTYAIISPLIIIPGICYYSWAYFVYRFRYSQFGRRGIETGGLFWQQCSQQLVYGLIMAQLSVLLQCSQFRYGIAPSVVIVILLTITILFIPFLKRHFGRICDSLSVLDVDIQRTKTGVRSYINQQNKHLPAAVACFENYSLVQSRLDADTKEHYNFTDIDPLIESFEPSKGNESVKELEIAIRYPEDENITMIPLSFVAANDEDLDTYDPLQVDSLVDTKYLSNQYAHPLMLKHSQVLIIPADLVILLKNSIQ